MSGFIQLVVFQDDGNFELLVADTEGRWRTAAGAWEDPANENWSTYNAASFVRVGATRMMRAKFPTDISAGTYAVCIIKRAAGSIALSDLQLPSGQWRWHRWSGTTLAPLADVDWADGGRLDLIIDEIKAKTDLIAVGGATISPLPEGAYCTRSDVEGVFGTGNVTKWADVEEDGDAATIAARITTGIGVATNDVDVRLRGGPYTIPFSEVDLLVRDITARLVGVWLYENRGIEDFNPETGQAIHLLSWHRSHAYKTLKEIKSRMVRLDIDVITKDIPVVVNSADWDNN